MEKEHHQPESLATVTIKPDYPPSEIYASSEAPPAYVKNVYASVQVARIIAVTIVTCSVILGFFLLASAYVTANASCKQLEQELEFLGDVAERFQPPLQPEALIQKPNSSEEESDSDQSQTRDNGSSVKTSENDNAPDSSSNQINYLEGDQNKKTTNFKLPLHLILDDLADALVGKNQKTQMKCVLEKRKEEQYVDRQPKTIALPFGLNLPTDSHLEKVSGEKLAIFCESGSAQRETPSKTRSDNEDQDEDQNEETIMIQPVMIPIGRNPMKPDMVQQNIPQELRQILPQMFPQQVQIQEHIMIRPHLPPFGAFPPKPLETMRPPMPFEQKIQEPNSFSDGFPPNPVLRQIAQQIVAERIMNIQKEKNEESNRETSQPAETAPWRNEREFPVIVNEVPQKMLLPEVILNHLNSLSAPNDVIVAIAEKPSNDKTPSQENRDDKPTVRIVQEPRTNPSVMNGRQSYAKALPSDVPQSIMNQPEQNVEILPNDEFRPHYVQPRSVRNKRDIRNVLEETSRRVKRCACDCAC